MGALDCDALKATCQSIGIKGFPSIRFFLPEKTVNPYTKKAHKMVQDYQACDLSLPCFEMDEQGGRGAKDIAAAAVSVMPSKVIIVNETNSADFFADEYPKALLFSQKSEVSGLYKSLSLKYKDRLRFGQTSDKQKDLVQEFNVGTKLPHLMVIPGEDRKKFFVHEGAINREEIPAFLDKHALEKPLVDPTFTHLKKLVHPLTDTTFNEMVLKDAEHPWLVVFLDKPPSSRTLQILGSFGGFVFPAVRVGFVVVTPALAKSQEVKTFPAIRLYQMDKTDSDDFLGASLSATSFPSEVLCRWFLFV